MAYNLKKSKKIEKCVRTKGEILSKIVDYLEFMLNVNVWSYGPYKKHNEETKIRKEMKRKRKEM